MKKAKVLKIFQCSNLGGMEKAVYWLLDQLKDETDFTIRSPRPFGPGESFLKAIDGEAQDCVFKGKMGWRSHGSFQKQLQQAAENQQAIWVTGTCTASLRAIKPLQQPKILGHHFHHGTSRTDRLKWRMFYELLCHQLDVITYPTQFTHDEALSIAPWLEGRTAVTPYAFIPAFDEKTDLVKQRTSIREELGIPEEAFVVGNAGWLIRRKRMDVFIKTAAKIKAALPNAFFVLCGGGPLMEELKKMSINLNIDDAFLFTDWVKNPEIYYRSWDVCLFNSDYDALGRTPIEAACEGAIPVASVRYGGLHEFITRPEEGFLIREHDTDALAENIIDLANNESRQARIRKGMIEKILKDYTPEKAAGFYRKYFNTLNTDEQP